MRDAEEDLRVPSWMSGDESMTAIELCRQELVQSACHERACHHEEPGYLELSVPHEVKGEAESIMFTESPHLLERLELASPAEQACDELLSGKR